ncbi:cytochrome P450, partial [Schizophyllum commune]
VPHKYTDDQDDMYRGYRIPKGSMIIPNTWVSISDAYRQATYPSPHDFKPDRFLKEDGTLDKEIFNPRDITFGYGRRICPGKDLAYTTLWLVAACVLRTCTVVKARRANGTVIEPPSECVGVGVAM